MLTKNIADMTAKIEAHAAADLLVQGQYWDADTGKGSWEAQKAAEAVAADSYKEGWWFAFRQWEQTGFVPNPDWKPIPPVEDNTP